MNGKRLLAEHFSQRKLRNSMLVMAALLSSCSKPKDQIMPQTGNTADGAEIIIIAHRGLSGEYPEHTLAGYQAAIEAGADFIEPDLVLTKDGVLVARHENEISETTNVAEHPEFSARKTRKVIDGAKKSGWFTEDFTLAELKTLRAKERLPKLRSKARDGQYEVPTFAEILDLLVQANKARHSPVGVYPETKHPSYFASMGMAHEGPLLQLLDQYGYRGRSAAVFIQSFEVENLKALRSKTDLPLIQLMDDNGAPADHPETSYAAMASAQGLKQVATYADGVGPNKSMVIPRNALGLLGQPTSFVRDAHAAGLKVHPWTFRRENYFLPLNAKSGLNPAAHGDLAEEVRAFVAAGVDGLFTDNTPEVAKTLR
jgi:glycerophosphoryl diester phosphodiesterase